MSTTRRQFDAAFRAAAVERLRNNETVTQVAKDLGIGDSILYRWRNQAGALRIKKKVRAAYRKTNGHAKTEVNNNTIHMEPFVLNEQTAIAIQKLADACASNARTLAAIAEKLGGPIQYGIGINTEGN